MSTQQCLQLKWVHADSHDNIHFVAGVLRWLQTWNCFWYSTLRYFPPTWGSPFLLVLCGMFNDNVQQQHKPRGRSRGGEIRWCEVHPIGMPASFVRPRPYRQIEWPWPYSSSWLDFPFWDPLGKRLLIVKYGPFFTSTIWKQIKTNVWHPRCENPTTKKGIHHVKHIVFLFPQYIKIYQNICIITFIYTDLCTESHRDTQSNKL